MARRIRIPLIVFLLGMLATAAAAENEGFAYDLASELMSPFCPGRTVSSCPSPQAGELIQWIQVQEAAGATEEEVVEMLIERFGEEILGAPPAEGITLWAYVFPVAGFVGGGGIVAVALRRIVSRRDDVDDDDGGHAEPAKSSGSAAPSAAADDDELERLVDEELSNRR